LCALFFGAKPCWQNRLAAVGQAYDGAFANLAGLKDTRNVFRETLRLYPPVPMMVRDTTQTEVFR
jgi:cytochrome P450